MIKVAAALNSFASQEATAPPSEEIFVLTSGQLQDLVAQAIERATAPLEARLDALEERGVGCGEGGEEPTTEATCQPGAQGSHLQVEKIVALEAENRGLKEALSNLEEITARERAFDRQRIAKLERVDPQPLQKDRGEILRALIAANGGKMLATDARKKMHLSRSRFSKLLATMKDEIEARPYHINKSWQVLVLR